jgi:major membrane immunogen (membrane-anchored lipoprotein)
MNKFAAAICAAIMLLLAGCGQAAYKDGEYTAISGKDQRGAYGEIKLTIRRGEITDSQYVTYMKNGQIKDKDYGKINGVIANQDYYDKAQLAVAAMARYNEQFKRAKSLKGVDAVSGATESHRQFMEAAEKALRQASK